MGAAAGQAIGAATGAVGGIYNTIQGAKQARDAQDALENYKRQELTNVAEGLQVSTLGADLQREEQSRLASGQIGALREGGARTLIGGLGRVEAGNQRVMRETAADLDMQQRQIDQMRAEDDARIRSMTENREIGDLSALSSQIDAGNQMKASGIAQITQAGSMAGSMFGKMGGGQSLPTEGFNVSGTAKDMTNPQFQMPTSAQNFKDQPNGFNFSTYQQPTYGPTQPYGVFNRYPYQPLYGPQNK